MCLARCRLDRKPVGIAFLSNHVHSIMCHTGISQSNQSMCRVLSMAFQTWCCWDMLFSDTQSPNMGMCRRKSQSYQLRCSLQYSGLASCILVLSVMDNVCVSNPASSSHQSMRTNPWWSCKRHSENILRRCCRMGSALTHTQAHKNC